MGTQEPGNIRPSENLPKPVAPTQAVDAHQLELLRGHVVRVFSPDATGGEISDHDYKEGRPAVIIQNRFGNATRSNIIVAFTRGAEHGGAKYLEQVFVPRCFMGRGGKDSIVECGTITDIDRSRINYGWGILTMLPPSIMEKVSDAIEASLAVGNFRWRG